MAGERVTVRPTCMGQLWTPNRSSWNLIGKDQVLSLIWTFCSVPEHNDHINSVWLNGNPGARNASLRLHDAPVCGISDAIQLVYSICHKNGYYKDRVVKAYIMILRALMSKQSVDLFYDTLRFNSAKGKRGSNWRSGYKSLGPRRRLLDKLSNRWYLQLCSNLWFRGNILHRWLQTSLQGDM